MVEKSSFTGNIERAIALSKWAEVGHLTADKPVKVASRDGATLFTAKVGIVVDTAFPTKAGNVTTAMVVVPLDGGKVFPIEGGTVKMDGIAPFIYQGRGVSHVFSVFNDAGDVVKRKTTRRSAQAEIDALNAKMDTLMAALAAMAKK